MPLFAEISVPQLIAVANILGLPGIILLLWWVDGRRMAASERRTEWIIQQHQSDNEKVLRKYEDDVRLVTQYYNSNVELVERYEKLAGELSGIIHLNTQIQTRLVEKIDNNLFCPIIREKDPRRNYG
jgi:hypothetical protein